MKSSASRTHDLSRARCLSLCLDPSSQALWAATPPSSSLNHSGGAGLYQFRITIVGGTGGQPTILRMP